MRNIFVCRAFASLTVLVFLCVGGGGASAAPREHDIPPAEDRFPPYAGVVPACSDAWTLNEITQGFAKREFEYWSSNLRIEGFDPPTEIGYRTNGLSYIPRRYCRAEAYFNDGVRRKVVYNIGEGLGFLGLGIGVTWCVEGLDRNHAFSPNCRAAGP